VAKGPGSLKAQAKTWSVVKAWVALECSRGLEKDEDSVFHWIKALEKDIHEGP
jgi:hypothetical protein